MRLLAVVRADRTALCARYRSALDRQLWALPRQI